MVQLARFPALDRAVRRLAGKRVVHDRDEVEYSRYIHSGYVGHCPPPPARTLEIGPGAGLGVSRLLSRDGHRAVAMDIVDLRAPVRDGDEARVDYLLGRSEAIPFVERSFDFIFSNSCLEHVADPETTIREIRRILRQGARTVHQIDFRDHRNYDDPLRFLAYGDRLWGLMNARGPGHQNRWRLSDFVGAFRRAGFEVEIEVNMVADPRHLAARQRFAPRYRDLSAEDLRTLSARLIARLPPR